MDDFCSFGSSFDEWLVNISIVLQRCEGVNLVLHWKKGNFAVQEGIMLCRRVSKKEIEVDKVELI